MIFKVAGDPTATVVIDYTNWRGVREERTITPVSLEWTHTNYHPEPQMMLLAFCHRAKDRRAFAVKNIHAWKE